MNIAEFINDPNLLGPYFGGPSWARWHMLFKAVDGLLLTKAERKLFHEVAGDRQPPKKPVREVDIIVGRGGGKDAASSGLAMHRAISVDPSRLRPGERAIVLCMASDVEQAGIMMAYLRGYCENVPLINQ